MMHLWANATAVGNTGWEGLGENSMPNEKEKIESKERVFASDVCR